jgi:hypothetical protein
VPPGHRREQLRQAVKQRLAEVNARRVKRGLRKVSARIPVT